MSLDTLRADRLDVFGYGRDTSPNLSALARRGVLFTEARAQASQTAPSHASLFTSEYPGAHRIVNAHGGNPRVSQLPAGVVTLAEAARSAGFETAAFVSGGNLTRRMGMDRGFDVWDEALTDVSQRVDALVTWMLAPQRGPFVALMHTYQTHAPYLPPAELVPRFTDAAYRGPLRDRTAHYLSLPEAEAWAAATGPAYWEGMLEYTEADVGFLSDLYDAEVFYVDQQLRRLIEFMQDNGLMRDTALVILSDHGEEFRDHGKFQHDQVYDELMHVPLLIALPRPPQGTAPVGRVDAPVELVDVAPTVAELLGIDASRFPWEGRSLVPLLRDPAASADREWSDRPVFGELVIEPGPKYHRSVIWLGWKYVHIWQSDIDHTWEQLFDLGSDPGERRNRIDDPAPEALKALQALRDQLERRTLTNASKAERLGDGGTVEMDEDMLELMSKLGYVELESSSDGR